jgi:hypothetical protein
MTRSRVGIAVVLVMVVLASWPGPAAGAVRGEPDLAANLADGSIAPGEETTLTLVLTNDATLSQVSLTNPGLAERVTTANGVSVTVESGNAPLSIERGGDQLLGSIVDGGRVTADVGVTVDADADPGTYHLDVTAEYSYASSISDRIGAVSQRTVEATFEVEVVVERDDVRFRVVDTRTTLRAGESGTFAATVEHTGQQTARDVRLQLRSLDGAVSPTGAGQASRYLGPWPAGERRTVSYRVTARPDVTATAHALELVPTYENAHGDATTGRPLAVGLTPVAGERFRVHGAAGLDSRGQPQLGVGGSDAITVAFTNRGPGAVGNVSVQLATTSPATTVDGGAVAERGVGRVQAGDDRTVTFDVGASPTARGGNYTFDATVTYDDTTGATVTSRTWPVTVRVQPSPTITLADLDSTLYVGERGTLSGTISNTGPTAARNAVLRVTEAPLGVQFTETAYPVGDLAGGQQASFSLPARVPAGTTTGPRAVTYVLAYETVDGTVVTSDPLRASVPVQPERDTFDLAARNGSLAPDSTEVLAVEITNTGDTPRTDVQVSLAPAPPFTSVAPSVYVGRLDPGESATVRFPIETDEDAVTASHAIAVNVSGETDDALTEHERHRVTVSVGTDTQPVDTVPIVVLGGLSVVLVAALGWWWFTRR